MGRPRMPRFLLKLPREVREEAREGVDRPPIEIGEGLEALELEKRRRGGEAVVERDGGEEIRSGCVGEPGCRRCWNSGGLCGTISWVASYTTADCLASCSITAAYKRSISR